ncbi:MAG: LamG-like jellyroll fold domain-containing protein [Kiritimatiellia bacterium]
MRSAMSALVCSLALYAQGSFASHDWYYPFDGNCNDAGTDGQNGIASSGVVFAEGHRGSCARFSGSDFISLPLDLSETADVSFSFWLKLEESQPGPYYAMVLSSDANTFGRGFAINLENDDYQVWLDDRFVNTGVPPVAAGQWQHVCLAYAPGLVKMYLDGKEAYACEGYTNAPPFLDSTNLLVGLRNLFFDRGLNGSVDDLHIYDRTLSPEEVVQLAYDDQSLLAYYTFEDNVEDSSPNAFHGIPSTSLDYEAGIHGRGLVLPPNPYVTLPIDLNSCGTLSFSFWMKINGALGNPEYGMFFSTDNNTFGRGLGVNARDNRFMTWYDDAFEYSDVAVPEVGLWKHVGMTYEPGRACFYIDGRCVHATTEHANPPPYNDATNITLGLRNLFMDRGANFSIDELRIYNRTLTSNEMQSIFGMGLTVTGLVVEGTSAIGPEKTSAFSCFAYTATGQRMDVTPGATFRLEPAEASSDVWFAGNVLHSGTPATDLVCQVYALYEHASGVATSAMHEVLAKRDDGDCLLAYYPLDGNAYDASGNALDGTVSGANVSTDAVSGACFSFNGRNTISLPVNLNPYGETSYSLWFKIMGTQPGPYYAMLLSSDDNTYGRGISITLTNSDFMIWFDDFFADTSCHTPTVGEWHHLAATYVPGDNVFYFDGIEVYRDHAHAGLPPFNDATNLLLGMRNRFFDRGFNGKIDEVKIYRCALSSNAVWNIYAAIASNKVNQMPVIQVVPDRTHGAAPCKITFDFADSYDPDGSIVRSEVDPEGDGIYEQAVEGAGRLAIDYLRPGSYATGLRVVDNFGAMASAAIHVDVQGAAPAVALLADPVGGNAPLSVSFEAQVEPTSTNVPVSSYQWDFDGDGAVDEVSATPQIRHVYGAAGEYLAGVSVVDADGVMGHGDRTVMVWPPSVPPVCEPALEFFPPTGFSPLSVQLCVLNASNCNATAIHWDCDGDGRVDAVSTNSSILHVYADPGKYWPVAHILFEDGSRIVRSNLLQISESSELRVWISQPKDGQTLKGDAVSLRANTAPGHLTGSVQFQYRLAAEAEWTAIGDWIDAPPYSFDAEWDVTPFLPGTAIYLRAVARDTQGRQVCSDTVQVHVAEPTAADLHAVEAVGSQVLYTVDAATRAQYRCVDGFEFSVTPYTVPSNQILSVRKEAAPVARGPSAFAGKEFLPDQYVFDFGIKGFSQSVQLLVPYPDADDDGRVDGTAIPESTLNAYGYNSERGAWQKTVRSDVDPVHNLVRTLVSTSCAIRLAGNPNLLLSQQGCILSRDGGDALNAPPMVADGNPLSFWREEAGALPSEIVFAFTDQVAIVRGISLLNAGGAACEPLRTFRVDLSLDGSQYSPFASGVLASSDAVQNFGSKPVVCHYVKLVMEEADSGTGATLHEIYALGTLGADADLDGLDDGWEIDQFNCLTNDAAADRDRDGRSNLEEFIAGTRADDPSSRLSLTLQMLGATAAFDWEAQAARSYTVFCATNLVDPDWQPIVTDATTGSNEVDATSFPGNAYFKLSVGFQ